MRAVSKSILGVAGEKSLEDAEGLAAEVRCRQTRRPGEEQELAKHARGQKERQRKEAQKHRRTRWKGKGSGVGLKMNE